MLQGVAIALLVAVLIFNVNMLYIVHRTRDSLAALYVKQIKFRLWVSTTLILAVILAVNFIF